MASQGDKNRVSLLQIFLTFAKIGAFTIGGGYAMMLLIQNEVVGKGWIKEDEFPDLIALSQAAPGLLAVNISIFAGYRIRGTKGSVVATLGSILPPFLIILIVAMVFSTFKDNPVIVSIFKGIRPVVVALIAVPMIQMARQANKKWWAWLITATALVLVAFLHISPIYILLVVIILSLSFAITRDRQIKMQNMRDKINEKNARETIVSEKVAGRNETEEDNVTDKTSEGEDGK